jgi:hypothetical protein
MRDDAELGRVPLVDVAAAGLSGAVRPRTAEAGCGREDERRAASVLERLELAALGDPRLVHVAAEDQLGARLGERAEDAVAVSQRSLPSRAPGRSGELVVQRHYAEATGWSTGESLSGAGERGSGERAALLAPRPHGAQSDAEEVLRAVGGLRRLEDSFPDGEGAGEPRRGGVRDVVVPRYGEERGAEGAEDLGCSPQLLGPSPVAQIPGRDDQLRRQLVYEVVERRDGLGRLAAPDMQVRDMENPCCHGRGRLYTRNVADEAPELFDDIYLGLRAGGAVRKQRRGEPLSAEEEEAIGRWQRLSLWRKSIAVGAFALGTFGLGFTVGGLIFGRWRTARR